MKSYLLEVIGRGKLKGPDFAKKFLAEVFGTRLKDNH